MSAGALCEGAAAAARAGVQRDVFMPRLDDFLEATAVAGEAAVHAQMPWQVAVLAA